MIPCSLQAVPSNWQCRFTTADPVHLLGIKIQRCTDKKKQLPASLHMLWYHYREIVDVTFPGATCSSVFSPAAEREPQFDDLAHLCFSFCTYASPWGSLTQPQPLRSSPRPCLGKCCTPWGCSSGLLNTLHSGNAAGYATLCVCLCVYSCTSNKLCHQLVMHHETVTLIMCGICAFQGISAMNYYHLSFNPQPRWNKKHIPDYTVPLLWM